jgi:EAL domain-containing protein (putative c-di-GMP-specific phosphodiesterase class I)
MAPTPKDPEDIESGGDLPAGPANPWAPSSLLYDSVTDLPTVPLLLKQMRGLLKDRENLGILSVSLVQKDRIEQLFGWKAFDDLIRQLALVLISIKNENLRREDLVSEVMVSGNAFVVVLSPPRRKEKISYKDLDMVRQRVQRRLREHLREKLPKEASDRFDLYVGCTTLEKTGEVRFERLFYQALEMAYADSLGEKAKNQRQDMQCLREVLEEGLVKTVYQPVICLPKRTIIGFEALSRVPTEKFGNIADVFKVAYENNSIWKLERLCREKAFVGITNLLHKDEHLFLNVEPDSIHDPQLQSRETLDLLHKANLSPDRIILEMTERSEVHDFTAFRKTLRHFQDQGFKLAIDDVGSAYSGLKSIAEVSPDYIKIDMSLIRDIHHRNLKRELLSTIFRFSQSTGIRLIAEGVEVEGELQALLEIGVEFAQGFLFSRPNAPAPRPDLTFLK